MSVLTICVALDFLVAPSSVCDSSVASNRSYMLSNMIHVSTKLITQNE